MTSRGRKYVLGCAGVGLLLLITLGGGFFWYSSQTRNSNEREALVIAQQLGYTKENELIIDPRCMGLSTNCGLVVVFRTPLTHDALQKQINMLGLGQRFEQPADGRSLFSTINSNTLHKLTVDGNDYQDIIVPLDKIPEAWWWALTTPEDRWVDIQFYDIMSRSAAYAFDDHPIRDNVVQLLLWDTHP